MYQYCLRGSPEKGRTQIAEQILFPEHSYAFPQSDIQLLFRIPTIFRWSVYRGVWRRPRVIDKI